ncbi:MAG: hypothetical protein JWL86_2119 [Rhizobium sp.]|nr:hypothetical protein [Rhizobium sp.]
MTARSPILTFCASGIQADCGHVRARNLGPELINALQIDGQQGSLIRAMFRVAVVQERGTSSESFPNIFGSYRLTDDGVDFFPFMPFERGVHYLASLTRPALGSSGLPVVQTLGFSLPKQQDLRAAKVTQIFPSSDELPENVLRFYVHFSKPMQRGRVRDEIMLLGPDYEPVPDSLYRPPVELWDRTMRRLTVLLDPGRLKRGLGPNSVLGPPLRAGLEYTLVIGPGMIDASGLPLGAACRKPFRVTDAVRDRVAVERWGVVVPSRRSRRPVVLTFPGPLDRAMLARSIVILSEDGSTIEGCAEIDVLEKRWTFTPAFPWAAETYFARVAPTLEDVCGNNLAGPFDRSLLRSHCAHYPLENLIALRCKNN